MTLNQDLQALAGEAELRLPRPPGVFRRWLTQHPVAVDWTIIGFYFFGCLLMIALEVIGGIASESFIDPADPGVTSEIAAEMEMLRKVIAWPWMIVRLLIVAVTATALRLRRRWPLAGVIVVAALLFVEQGMLVLPNTVAVMFLLYAVPVFRDVVQGWVAFGIVATMNALLMLFGGSGGNGMIGPDGLTIGAIDLNESGPLVLLNTVGLLAVLMIGINLGNRRRYVEALIDRAHQLAVEREQRAQLAVSAERSRIAREMHDIVAHSLSVVVTLAEGASVAVERQPEAAKQAMERAAETGRGALVEMRRLLGVLNDESGGAANTEAPSSAPLLAPQPDLAQLSQLLDGFREAGLRITMTEQGTPCPDSTHQLAVFRIVQEGLTNTLRYAGQGAEVRAVLEHQPDATLVEITDRGPVPGAPRAEVIPGSGRGLAGARERARMFGGTLESHPHGSGWQLRASIPIGQQTERQDP